jgi:heat shock protein HtpX
MNYLKTGILLILLTLLFVWVGQAVGGRTGAAYAFILALIMNVASYWFSDKIVLAMYRARPVSREEAPAIYDILDELTKEARLPMPRLYTIPQRAANAFATGRNPKNAVVCVTDGIMGILDADELKGVLAHELAHVKNRDILIMTITAVIAGAVMMIANMVRWSAIFGGYSRDRDRGGSNVFGMLALTILAPLAAMLVQLAISRSREYAADAAGAAFARDPRGLARALRKLRDASKFSRLDASPQTAHMFIVNPLSGSAIANLFSTHPPVEERIKRLEAMA